MADVLIVSGGWAGQTTLMYRLAGLKGPLKTISTVGYNTEMYRSKTIELKLYDIGYRDTHRCLCPGLFPRGRIAACIYLFSRDRNEQFLEFNVPDFGTLTKDIVSNILPVPSPETSTGPRPIILILATKSDLDSKWGLGEITKMLGPSLDWLSQNAVVWTIKPCSLINEEGLDDAMAWLTNQILLHETHKEPEELTIPKLDSPV